MLLHFDRGVPLEPGRPRYRLLEGGGGLEFLGGTHGCSTFFHKFPLKSDRFRRKWTDFHLNRASFEGRFVFQA